MDLKQLEAAGTKIKKNGQQYTKKELKQLGWTGEMLSYLPACTAKNKQQIYYRASDVRALLEQHADFTDHLLSAMQTKAHDRKLRELPNNKRAELAQHLSTTLQCAFEAAEMDPDIRCVAAVWHECFIKELLTPQPKAREIMYPIVHGDCVISQMLEFAAKGRAGTTTPTGWVNRWKKLGRSAWTLLTCEGLCPEDGYIEALTTLAKNEIKSQLTNKGVSESAAEILSIKAIREQYPCHHFLYDCYITYYIPQAISRDLSKLIAIDPKDEYPAARQMSRRFEIHVGGTNTGKTYESLQRLKKAASGVYLAPLRLLALEVQERLLEDGIVCSMLTGEEEDIREGATHISSTVEKLDIGCRYAVAVIDECQMISDRDRGFAWTRAILGVQADEIHLCVAPEGLRIVERIIKALGEPYKVIRHERKVPLVWTDRPVKITQAKAGDAFVAFSKKRVLQLADELRHNGVLASIIYGNLPYATRRRQMELFLTGETTVLVATDAIGMGLNLPIRRVIFTEDEKYDGVSTRPLRSGEVRQIAGRAGRFGIYDEGFASAGPDCNHDLGKLLDTVPSDIVQAALGFSDLVLKVEHPLIDVLKVWNQMPVKAPYYRMDISRHIMIINYIQNTLQLSFSKEDLLRAANIPFDEKDDSIFALFGIYCKEYASGATEIKKPDRTGNLLGNLELYYKSLDLYYSFSKNFGFSWDKTWLMQEKELVAEEINYLLIHDLQNRGASCRRCGGPIPLKSPYSICDKCYHLERKKRVYQNNRPGF